MTTSRGMAVVSLIALLPAGCTLDAGRGFATMDDGALDISFDATAITDRGYGLDWTAATLRVDRVALVEREEPIVTMPVGGDATLGAPRLALRVFEPSRELPMATIDATEVVVGGLSFDGTATGGALGDRAVPLRVRVGRGGSLSGPADIGIGRDGPARLAVDVTVALGADLLDGVDLAALEAGGQIAIEDVGPAAPIAEGVRARLLAVRVQAARR